MSRTWFNGALAEGPLAVERGERGLLLGDGLFETILVLNRTALWGNMHFARLEAAAGELGLGFDRGMLDDAVEEILAGIPRLHHVLRVTLTRGAAARGLAAAGGCSSLLLMLDAFDPAMMLKSVALSSTAIRRNPASVSCRLKTLSYIDNIAAAREAAGRGAEDALMLNTAGHVACTTIANVFLLRGKALITPARDQGILTGVTRQTLLHSAAHLGLKPEERVVRPEELKHADAVFLTNSLRFIRPVTALDREPLAQADLGPLVQSLCETARLQCGHDPRMVDLARAGR
ncbi:aminotransferase class IV [Aestuariivirga sp.]|uniref:aminotransferase class IV n=1 Tax=Aestuariivirga sp. TaxID=2650926 RepID=UPI0025BCD0FC|nr:aminotransferase class IV [Aestuariivirga sp.]MCA3556201.1 aminotransferase class IV [Aestuariivirga sp.]